MARIEVDHITLADAANPGVTFPNIVPRSAQALAMRLTVHSLPANATGVDIIINMYQSRGRPGLNGWFNSRDKYIGPITVRLPAAGTGQQTFSVHIPHPPDPDNRFADFSVTASFNLFWRILIEYYWHGGPGPYDAEAQITAHDSSGTPIQDSKATFNYPFVSV